METNVEELEHQKTPEGTTPTVEEVKISKAELDDLKHKAEVSSQNFERAKKAELEVKDLESRLTTEVPSDEVFSDEGKALKGQITSLESELASIKDGQVLQGLYAQYPVLKDKSADFDEFRQDYPRTKLENVAKLYLSENGLLEPKRVGLEKTTGGPRTPVSSEMTTEEIKKLRETDSRKYRDMLQKGLIKV